MKRKLFFMILLVLLGVIISNTVLAATVAAKDTILNVTDDPVCTININENAVFTKKLSTVDIDKKELTIDLNIVNNAPAAFDVPTEIFLVIDNSSSMEETVADGTTRLEAVISSAKTLATSLLDNENIEIGVVSFSTGAEEGTISDATLITTPTNVASTISTAIDSIAESTLGIRTNIDAGLSVAYQNFSEDCASKYVVLLTDGVPNTAVGGPTLTYSGETATKTKATLQNLVDNNVNIYTVMTGVTTAVESQSNKTYQELAEEIFGTSTNPLYGNYYFITDDEIEETITESVFNDMTDTSMYNLENVKIYDYFPQEIVDNFTLTYSKEPTMGTISETIQTTTPTDDTQEVENYILWEIDTLKPQESADVTYVLTIKENIDSSIIDIVLNTNKKVNIRTLDNSTIDTDTPSTDDSGDKYNVDTTSTVTPKIKLTMPVDTTVTNTVIPQTGETNFYFIGIGAVLLVVAGYAIYRAKTINK